MNDEIKNKLKIKMTISKMKNEEEKNMNRTGKFIFKTSRDNRYWGRR